MQAASSLNAPLLPRVALASLIALILVSLAFVVAVPVPSGARGLPPGAMLALIKVVALVFLCKRVLENNVYSLQWSSMFILLFIAEGTVRATSDPQPSAAIGWVETGLAAIYFASALAILRPLKKKARAEKGSPR
jgi:uncharacterized membrane protein